MGKDSGAFFFFLGLKPADLQPCSCPGTRNVEGPSEREGSLPSHGVSAGCLAVPCVPGTFSGRRAELFADEVEVPCDEDVKVLNKSF